MAMLTYSLHKTVGPATLLQNETETENSWMSVKTVGVISNRDGIGTRVTVKAGGYTQTQEVNPGSSYLSTHDARCYFGLGANTTVDRLELRWQSGVVQVFENLPANREHVISEFSDTPEDRRFKAVWTGDIAALRGYRYRCEPKRCCRAVPLYILQRRGETLM